MKLKYLLFAVVALLAITAGYLFSSNREAFRLDQYTPQLPGGDFSLQSINGPVSLSDFKGKVVLVYFGYSYCPDVCPTALSLTGAALKQMDEQQLSQVQSLFISVDPARDDVTRLDEYAHFFHPSMIGLTGSKTEIDAITRRYGAYYKIIDNGSATDYPVDHSSQTVVVGKDGKIKSIIRHGTAPDKMIEIISEYL